MSTEVINNLRQARALLADDGWCLHEFAIDKDGVGVGTMSPDAVKFCISGAIARVKGMANGYESWDAPERKALQETLNLQSPGSSWRRETPESFNNNQTSVEPVLGLIDTTIARLEAYPDGN